MDKRNSRGRRSKVNLLLPVIAGIMAVAAFIVAAKLFIKPSGSFGTRASSIIAMQNSTSSAQAPSTAASQASSKTISSSSSSQADSSGGNSSDASSSGLSGAKLQYFDDAVFLGDSLTEGIDLYGVLDNATIIANNGLSTYTAMKNAQPYNGKKQLAVDAVAAKKPGKIYILLGSNDMVWMKNESAYTGYYQKLVKALKSKCPKATIYIQSIFPVTSSYEAKKPQMKNDRIDAFNKALKEMCSEAGVTYLDVASVLKGSNGKLPANASDDGLHLKKAYYYKWFNYLGQNEN